MKSTKTIIEETIKHIKKNGRCLVNGHPVYYNYLTKNCCSVGRCMENPTLVSKEYAHFFAEGLDKHVEGGLDVLLDKSYRGHHIKFWQQIQTLHDCDDLWHGNNLNEAGEEYLAAVKKKFSKLTK